MLSPRLFFILVLLSPWSLQAQVHRRSDIVDTRIYYHGEQIPAGLAPSSALLTFDCRGTHLHIRMPRDPRRHSALRERIGRELAELSALGVFELRGGTRGTDVTAYSLAIGRGIAWTAALVRRRLRESVWIFGRRTESMELFVRLEASAFSLGMISHQCLPEAVTPPTSTLPVASTERSTPAPALPENFFRPLPSSAATAGVDSDALFTSVFEQFHERILATRRRVSHELDELSRMCRVRVDSTTAQSTADSMAAMERHCLDNLRRARNAAIEECAMRIAIGQTYYGSGGSRELINQMYSDFMGLVSSSSVSGPLDDTHVSLHSIMLLLGLDPWARQEELARFSRVNGCGESPHSTLCAEVSEEVRSVTRPPQCDDPYADKYIATILGSPTTAPEASP